MSLGLIYPPSSYGDLEEFIVLAKVLKKHEAILTVHMRSESTHIFDAVREMLKVAESSHVHLQISHLKLIGKPQWGKADELLAMIKEARSKGLDVTCDQYPYTATSTNMAAMVPGWAQSGGPEAMCKRLAKPSEELLKEIKIEMERRGGADKVLIVSTHACTVEDKCLIGIGATVLDGSVIGTGSIIGAGCLVTRNTIIPPNSLVVGVPGKIIKTLPPEHLEDIYANALKYKTLWAERYGFLPDNTGERYDGHKIV